MRVAGVYVIRNECSSRVYVGSSSNVSYRWAAHKCDLRKGRHSSQIMQRAWQRDGEAAFSMMLLEEVADLALLEPREQAWMDALGSHKDRGGYNLAPNAISNRGHKHTAETRAKVSAAGRGRPMTLEHRAKIADAHMGKKHPRTAEWSAKIAAAMRGQKRGPMSDETKALMSRARLGVKLGPMSVEALASRRQKVFERKRWEQVVEEVQWLAALERAEAAA